MNKFNSLTEENQVKIKKELHKIFSTSLVKFVFEKKDGTHRDSLGCLDDTVISQYYTTKQTNTSGEQKSSKPQPIDLFKYFDIDKKSWRSFNISSLVYVLEVNANDFFDKIILKD